MRRLQCGQCHRSPIVWVEWPTIGRPKGTYKCEDHYDPEATDNRGRPRYSVVERIVHLHRPTSGPVCGADMPQDRKAGLTAYRSEVTCMACRETLR